MILVLAFSCVVASLTLVVGNGAVIMKSLGGGTALAPCALATFYLGMSLISFTCTHWMFKEYGRKSGFQFGIVVAMVGVIISVIGICICSPVIVLLGNLFLGAGTGVGMYLRFAAVEVLPSCYANRAVTWTLCGGCLAAFAGPESALLLKGLFGEEEHMKYLGVFLLAGFFYIAQGICVNLISFPSTDEESKNRDALSKVGVAQQVNSTAPPLKEPNSDDFWSLLRSPNFYIPLFVSILSWTLMAMPMGISRVSMHEFGYTPRQSLSVIELHFLGMYSPGLYSGVFLKKYGPLAGTLVSIIFFGIATTVNLLSQNNVKTIVTWYLGLIFLGIGWNFGYSSATVWVARAYQRAPHHKGEIQAANEGFTFLICGATIFSTGYVYDYAGGDLPGWQLINAIQLGWIGLLAIVAWSAQRIQTNEMIILKAASSVIDKNINSNDSMATDYRLLEKENKVEC